MKIRKASETDLPSSAHGLGVGMILGAGMLVFWVVVAGLLAWRLDLLPHFNRSQPVPVVTVVDGDDIPLMTYPTRLDIVMVRNDANLLRCAQMGGRVENATYEQFTCNGVDF